MSEEKKTDKETSEAIRKDVHTIKNILVFYLVMTIIALLMFLIGLIVTAGEVIMK